MTNAQDKFYEKLSKYDMSTRWAYSDFCHYKKQYKINKEKGWSLHANSAKKKAIESYYRFECNRFDCLNEERLFNKYGTLMSDLSMMSLGDFERQEGVS